MEKFERNDRRKSFCNFSYSYQIVLFFSQVQRKDVTCSSFQDHPALLLYIREIESAEM